MDNNEFNLGLIGDPLHTADGKTQIRYIVADGFELIAKELRAEGRPDKAARLQWIAGELNTGGRPTKRVMSKCSKEIEVVRGRLVDGKNIGRYSI